MLLCGFTATWAAQTVVIAPTTNGTVTFSPEAPTPGGTVTLTVTPDPGYKITKSDVEAELTIDPGSAQAPSLMDVTPPNVGVKLELGGEDPADLNASREYTFTMPEEPYSVLVTATFTGIPLFDVTVASSDHGSVTADKAQAAEGETVTLTITPETGYELDELYYMNGTEKVTITGTSFQMPAANVEVHATFKLKNYNITAGTCEHGSVSADKATANMGETVTLTANPDQGYELEAFTVSCETINQAVTVNEDGTFTMPADNVTVTATFRLKSYTITAGTCENGSVSADKATANMGETVTLTANPDQGYELEAFTVSCETINQAVTVNEDGTFTMPADNVTVTAIFRLKSYTITAGTCENGSVSADKATANMGETVTLTANPAEGYELDHFTVSCETINQAVTVNEDGTFTMPADNVTVTATFKKSTYTITVVVSGGNGEASADKTQANMGDVITITATPAANYELDQITVTYGENGTVEVSEANTFVMPAANVTVTVTFKAKKYNVIVEESVNGSVSTDKTEAAVGEKVTLTISPAPEFELDVLTVDGQPVEVTGNTYEFNMPAHDVTVTATFKAIVHTYTVVGTPAAVFGSDQTWDLNNPNALMTPKGSVYIWISEPTYMENGVSLRVVQDNSWAVAYPEQNCYIGNIKPGTYVLIVVFDPETGEVSASLDGQADVYVFGNINGNVFAPNLGLKMESEDGKIYTASVTIPDVEDGYGFFAFTHKLSTDASDWGTANGYRFLAQSNGNFLVNGPTMNKGLDMEYNSSNAMKIPAGEYTLTVDLENMKLTITGGTQLSYILASGVEGVDYTVINNLAVVERHQETKQFFTSDGNDNWMTIKGGDFFDDAILVEAMKGGYVSGVFSDKNMNPYLTLTVAPQEAEGPEVEPKTYSLTTEFTPKVDEVINVEKAYYKESDNALRAYAPGPVQGQSLTLDTSLFEFNFTDGGEYNVLGVINIKEPWTIPSGINPLDYDYPFQNYKLLVLDVEEVDPTTSINEINAEQGVKSVRYYNLAGVESTTPFNGVNIIIKEMVDGSKVTTKAIIK
jgi:hypothetical protein